MLDLHQYFKNRLIKKLIVDLDKAEKIVSEYSGGYSGEFIGAEEFHEALRKHIQKLKKGDTSVLNDLWVWFAPTCQWDDFVGNEGIDLGNRIFERLNKLKK